VYKVLHKNISKSNEMSAYIKATNGKDDIQAVEQDLLLAAEIGKSLLERNRELEGLLKSTQEYAEEQNAQVEFYIEQVSVLRESSESYSHSYEHLESTHQQLIDKYEQQKDENKLIEGKNQRLWERINSLEKRNEELTNEIKDLEKQISEQNELVEKQELNHLECNKNQVNDKISISNDILLSGNQGNDEEIDQLKLAVVNLENDKKVLHGLCSQLKVQSKIEKWQKEEMTSQIDDVISENQLLHHKISNLKQEVLEWENFAQKEENYRKLAEAFNIKHNNVEFDHDEQLLTEMSPRSKYLIKAKSCEFLNRVSTTKENTCIIKSSNLVKEILSNNTSGNFLSELDSEYADLIQRYEALLEKCKQEGKFNENPERTRKVQRAIQTLSFDFSTLTAPITSTKVSAGTSITPTVGTPVTEHDALVAAVKTSGFCPTCKCKQDMTSQLSPSDNYKMLFAEIFAKIKESKTV